MLGERAVRRGKLRVAKSLQCTATNLRSGESFPCRVDETQRQYRETTLPLFMYLPQWNVVAAVGTDIVQGDSLSVLRPDASTGIMQSDGTYRTLSVKDRQQFQVDVVADCVQTVLPDGSLALGFVPNASVEFASSADNRARLVTVPAYVDELTKIDREMFVVAAEARYKVVYPAATHYGSDANDRPREGNFVRLAGFEQREDLTNRPIIISRPRIVGGIVPWAMTTFKEA